MLYLSGTPNQAVSLTSKYIASVAPQVPQQQLVLPGRLHQAIFSSDH